MKESMMTFPAKKQRQIYWPTTLFFIITPLVAFIGLPLYFWHESLPLSILVFSLVFAALTNLSVTAGYHRLFAHKSYEAHPLVKIVFLLIGASAWQGSALKWSSDHRKHHSKVDSEEDPYAITKGFWYAHMGWLFFRDSVDQPIHAPDLQKDPWMARQDRYYIPLAIFMAFGVPTFFGWIVGAPVAGLLVGGVFRTLVTQQSTFFVNSLSHTLGRKTYAEDVSARDSIFVAILTHGEGYHNFHHKFQTDYRNGIRWYHWDPTKWAIWFLSTVGLAKRLRRMSEQEILRARLQVESFRLKSKGFSEEKLEKIKAQILSAQMAVKKLKAEVRARKNSMSSCQPPTHFSQLKIELALARMEFRFGMRQWRRLLAG